MTDLNPTKMKAIKVNEFGGPEVLHYEDSIKPIPHPGEVLIEVHASSINPVDAKSIETDSNYKEHLKLPVTPGTDVAGVVSRVGEGITDVMTGDRVFGQAGPLQKGTGAFAEYAVTSDDLIAPMPTNISFKEAAALPLAAASAYLAIFEHIKLKKRQKILIHGGSGGIGSFAIQLAKHVGAYVATTATVEGIDFAKRLGADEVVDYEFQSFESILKDFDAVLDTVGGDTYKKSFSVLRKGGIIVSMLQQPDEALMKKYEVRAVLEMTQVNRELLNKIAKLVEDGVLEVNIAKTFSLKDIRKAYDAKEDEKILGKIAIEVK
jgi:NADPH:quinone reductase-like Zn-dependent oxidoreductase